MNKLKTSRNLGVFVILVLIITAFSDRKLKIMIIGDSISLGYTPYVKEYFSDHLVIVHNPGNAQHTGTGLEKIKEWIGNEDWDIIQFNWGLWDLCYRHPDSEVQGNRDKINGKITYSIEDYKRNLDSIITTLKKITDSRLVFVTTTYVPENEAGRFAADAVKYNEAAIEIMKKNSIIVNDIYEQSIPIHKKFGKGVDDVHYTKEGYEKLSNLIINFLEIEIESFGTE